MKFRRITIGFVFALLMALSLGVHAQKSNDSFSQHQVMQIQDIVHSYLVTHPEVLVEASRTLQKQAINKMETTSRTAIISNAGMLFDSKISPVSGNPDGKVTLIEFFDYQSPHCIDMAPVIESLIKYNNNLRVVSMELPVFGAVSEYAARAALAAGMQNKYWEMRTAIFSANQRLTKTVVDKVAMKVGLNLAELNKDMNSEAVTTQLNTIRTLAEKLKLAGTPAFIVAPSDFYQSHNVSKLSFFPGPASGKQLQTFINKAE